MKPLGAVVLIALALLAGCAQEKPKPTARAVKPAVVRDYPAVLRGTIGTEGTLLKAEPVLVSGYGIVVGLPGTGGGDLDEGLSATMERMIGLMGVGMGSEAMVGTPLEGKSPGQVLRSKDVAVVVVYAAVVPGAPKGTNFDVFVRAASNTPDISLEGGTLWSTELRIGPATQLGGMKTRVIASARGPIFINPFAEPGVNDGYSRRTGRVLAGGTMTAPLDLELVLDNESYSRARLTAQAINNRFPPDLGSEQTARGRNSLLITITVPAAYRERAGEFLELLRHIQIDQSMPQEYARKYSEALKTDPYLASDLSWCLQALPQKAAIPFIRELYDWPEMAPRLAALRAGAGLNDPLAAPQLKDLSKDAPTALRVDAIRLLGELTAGPTVDLALREQLNARELAVRVAAYEALVGRAELVQLRRWKRFVSTLPAAARISLPEETALNPGILEITGDTIQGITRRVISNKFILDVVPVGEPVIYVTQQGRPRIVLFGENLKLKRPAIVSAWSDRLMLVSDSPTDEFRLLYRTPEVTTDTGQVIGGRNMTAKFGDDLVAMIAMLARKPTPESPEPGLGMTYSQVVGALYAFQRGGAIPAYFAVEEDLLRARLLEAANTNAVLERPDTQADAEKLKVYAPVDEPQQQPAPAPVQPQTKPDLVVPLEPPTKKKGN